MVSPERDVTILARCAMSAARPSTRPAGRHAGSVTNDRRRQTTDDRRQRAKQYRPIRQASKKRKHTRRLWFDIFPTLYENMTSFTKPEAHIVSHCRQRMTEPPPHVACIENLVKFGRGFWPMRADRQTSRQTDIQTLITIIRTPNSGEVTRWQKLTRWCRRWWCLGWSGWRRRPSCWECEPPWPCHTRRSCPAPSSSCVGKAWRQLRHTSTATTTTITPTTIAAAEAAACYSREWNVSQCGRAYCRLRCISRSTSTPKGAFTSSNRNEPVMNTFRAAKEQSVQFVYWFAVVKWFSLISR